MTDQTPADVIAEAYAGASEWSRFDDHFTVAAEQALAALAKAGYAVVRLPGPDQPDGPGYTSEWNTRCANSSEGPIVWTAPGGLVMIQRVEPGELAPGEARTLAAALLAAANLAEEATR